MTKEQKRELIKKHLENDIVYPQVRYVKDGDDYVEVPGWPRSYNEIAADLELEIWREKMGKNKL